MKFVHFLLLLFILVLLSSPAFASSYMKKQNCAKKVTIYIDDCESSGGHQGCDWPYPPPPPGCDGSCLASCIPACNSMPSCITGCTTKCGC